MASFQSLFIYVLTFLLKIKEEFSSSLSYGIALTLHQQETVLLRCAFAYWWICENCRLRMIGPSREITWGANERVRVAEKGTREDNILISKWKTHFKPRY